MMYMPPQFKSEDRAQAHAAMRAAYAAGNENERALDAWMDKLGLHGV